MKLNVFYGRTYFEGFEKLVLDLKNNYSQNENYMFIVPDRFTLFTEKYIMEKLNIISSFNIDVLTLNTLANRNCMINDYLDNETATMVLSKVLFNIKENEKKNDDIPKLQVLKSTNSGFCDEIYALIQQIKSSRVSSEDLLNCFFGGTDYEKMKKQDIALIYSEYEKYLGETRVDDVKKFEIFIEQIKNIEAVANSYIYIGGFESFTSQGYAIIENLIRYSKGVKISTMNYLKEDGRNQSNSYLYPCDVSYRVAGIARSLKIECKVDDKKLEISNPGIVENLWSTLGKCEDNVNVYKAESQIKQYRKVAEFIWDKIINNGCHFSDFNVVMNIGDNNERVLKNVLNDYKISYFLDNSQPLADFMVIKFICQVNECINKRFDRLSFIEYSKSPFVDGSEDEKNTLENFADKYSIRYTEFYKEKESLRKANGYEEFITYSKSISENILAYRNLFKVEKDSISNYISATRELVRIFDLETKFSNILEEYKGNDKEIQYRYGQKVFERLETILTNLDRVLGETRVSFREYSTILSAGLRSAKISIVPQSVDAVFVSNINSGFFLPRKYNLFVDTENNLMPNLLSDNGIFTDEDIDNTATKLKIEPQIKLLNKKKKLKVLSMLSLGEIVLLYNCENGKEPSKIIGDLEKICNVKYIDDSEDYYFSLGNNSLLDYLAYINGYENDVKTKINEYLSDNIIEKFNTLIDRNSENKYLSDIDKNLFFKNESFSVSQIECFYNCPYKHFMNYGLKIKERYSDDMNAVVIGNIVHEFCQQAITKLDTQDILDTSKKIFDDILNKEEYLPVKNNTKMANTLSALEKECTGIFEVLQYHLQNMEFDGHKMEEKFVSTFRLSEDNDRTLKLAGKIDRIDFSTQNGDFVIIDYKTGSTELDYKDIYYGKKIQIVAYSWAIENLNTNKYKNCIGLFYMPIHDKYVENNKSKFEKFKLSGFYYPGEDYGNLFKLDKRLRTLFDGSDLPECDFDVKKERKSDIINAYITAKNNTLSDKKDILTQSQMDYLKSYVVEILRDAISEIERGNIAVLPWKTNNKNACEFCAYKGICKVNRFTKMREINKVSKVNFFGSNEGDEVVEDE